MPSADVSATTRRSAAERREEIVTVAIRHFARSGYHAASTDAIARDAGISQPYLFRLFGTKRDLFLACHERLYAQIAATFTRAAEGLAAAERLPAMGRAYRVLLADREILLFQMQSYAACSDREIQDRVRRRYVDLVRAVAELSGADDEQVWTFFSDGMLLNVVASLDLDAIAGEEPWVAGWTNPEAAGC